MSQLVIVPPYTTQGGGGGGSVNSVTATSPIQAGGTASNVIISLVNGTANSQSFVWTGSAWQLQTVLSNVSNSNTITYDTTNNQFVLKPLTSTDANKVPIWNGTSWGFGLVNINSITVINALPSTPTTNNLYRFVNTANPNGTYLAVNVVGSSLNAKGYLFNGDLITWDGTNWRLLTPDISTDYNIAGVSITIDGTIIPALDPVIKFSNQRRFVVPFTITFNTNDVSENLSSITPINHVDAWNFNIAGYGYAEQTCTGYTVTGPIGQQLVTLTGCDATANITAGNWIVVYNEDQNLTTTDNLSINGNNVGCFKVTAVTANTVTFINPQNMAVPLTASTINYNFKRITAISSDSVNFPITVEFDANSIEVSDIAFVSSLPLQAGLLQAPMITINSSSIYLVGILCAANSSSTANQQVLFSAIASDIKSDTGNIDPVGIFATGYMNTNGTGGDTFITSSIGFYNTRVYLGGFASATLAGLGYISTNSLVTVDGSRTFQDSITKRKKYGTTYGSWYVDNGSSLNSTHIISCNCQTSGLVANNNSRITTGNLDNNLTVSNLGYYTILRNNGFSALYCSGSSRIALGATARILSNSTTTYSLIVGDQNSSIIIDNVGITSGADTYTGYLDASSNTGSSVSVINLNNASFQVINDIQKLSGSVNYTSTSGSAFSLVNSSNLKLNTGTQNFLANNPTSFTGDIVVDAKSFAFFNNNPAIFKLTSTGTINNVITASSTANNTITITTTDANIVVGIRLRLNLSGTDFGIYYTVTAVNGLVITIKETIPTISTGDYVSGYGTQAFLLPDGVVYNGADGLIGGV